MRPLFSQCSLPAAVAQVSKLAVGSAIAILLGRGSAIALSSLPTITDAQTEPVGTATSLSTKEQPESPLLAAASSPTVEEKISWLDAAVVEIDNIPDDESRQISALRAIARSYSSLGSQTRAVELLDRAVAIAKESESRYLLPVRIIPTYIEIGEIEIARSLLAQAVASDSYVRPDYLIDIVEAYSAADRQDLAIALLSQATDRLESIAAQGNERSLIYTIGEYAQAYGRLDDKTAIEADLSRLIALVDADGEIQGTDRSNRQLVTALSQLSIAQSKQGNADVAETFAARAMEIVRDGEETGYISATVASAYGYLANTAVAEQALPTLMQLATEDLGSIDPLGPVSLLRAVAIAYEQIDNTAKSEEALAVITDQFEDLYMLGAILGIYVEMDNAAGQEATIQKMFDWLPLLREAEFTVSDVTAGYSGISGLLEAYIYTADDALAQERLALLESFFKDVHFDPLYIPGQLATLARAASSRGDDAAAQRLLAEGTQRLEADIDVCGRSCVGAINSLARSYTLLDDDSAKQSGFNKLQQISDEHLDAEKRELVRSYLIRYRAVL